MSDYISREAAIELLHYNADERCSAVVSDFEEIPAADVEPVRHGQWGRTDDDWNSLTTFQCSVCGEEYCFECDEDILTLNYKYCPNCGAKMDLEDKNEN